MMKRIENAEGSYVDVPKRYKDGLSRIHSKLWEKPPYSRVYFTIYGWSGAVINLGYVNLNTGVFMPTGVGGAAADWLKNKIKIFVKKPV